jgi:effector-binding domain-containing protein
MKILKYILYGILAIVVIFLLIAAFASNKVKVERSITINAPADVVFANVKTLRNMQEWSPWAELDPKMEVTYTGNDGEVSSTSSWKGNKDVGSGTQTITAVGDNRVEMEVAFKEPFESKAQSYVIVEKGDDTKATWGFESETPFPWNAMHVFMDMDAMLGKDFEKGLTKLKALSEGGPGVSSAKKYDIHEMEMDAKTYIAKREIVAFKDMGNFYGTNFPAISQALAKAKMKPSGPPSSVFYKWDEKEMKADAAAAIPVADPKAKVPGYETIHIPASKVVHVAYYGNYDKSGDAHMAIGKHMEEKGMKNGNVIEEYVTDPMTEKDTAKWLTNIYYVIK